MWALSYTLGGRAFKPQRVSRNSYLLAFRVVAIQARRLVKAALKRTTEAGRMLIANFAGDLLDPHVGALQQLGCPLQPLLDKEMAKTKTGLPLEQMLKMRLAYVEFTCETVKAT